MDVDHDRGILAYGTDEGDRCKVGFDHGHDRDHCHEEARYPESRQLYASAAGVGQRVPELYLHLKSVSWPVSVGLSRGYIPSCINAADAPLC